MSHSLKTLGYLISNDNRATFMLVLAVSQATEQENSSEYDVRLWP